MYKKYIISPHISWQSLMDKLYIIDECTHKMYVLDDSISKQLWEAIRIEDELQKVIKDISLLYQMDENIVLNDCNEWFKEMENIGILRMVS